MSLHNAETDNPRARAQHIGNILGGVAMLLMAASAIWRIFGE